MKVMGLKVMVTDNFFIKGILVDRFVVEDYPVTLIALGWASYGPQAAFYYKVV